MARHATPDYNLAVLYPELAKEWIPDLNNGIESSEILPGSGKKGTWKCPDCLYQWDASPNSRIRGGEIRGCPACAGKVVTLNNSLAAKYPDIAKEWHPTKNESNITPELISPGSHKPRWWLCAEKHEWKVAPKSRTRNSGTTSCPYCSNQKSSKENSLLSLFPDIAKEWHPTKNAPLTPDQVVPGSAKKAWWLCSQCSHSYRSPINSRTRLNTGCTACAGKEVNNFDQRNSLAKVAPDIAKEWHPTKNNNLTPTDVVAGSHKKVWWKCPQPLCQNEWSAVIKSRVKNDAGCPICGTSGWTIPRLREFIQSLQDHIGDMNPAQLYAVCQQQGILNIKGSATDLGSRIATGKIPYEEIKKFGQGEPSTLDELIPEGWFQENNPSDLSKPEKYKETGENLAWTDGTETTENEHALTLPEVSAGQALSAVDTMTALVDGEVADFLVASTIMNMWKDAFKDEKRALKEVRAFKTSGPNSYGAQVKKTFLAQYKAAKDLKIPKGYQYTDEDGKAIKPNLMQRLVASRLRDEKRMGNWSGTGAGKTLSAIIASRAINANLTVICCPNSVVDGWAKAIKNAYPDVNVQIKDLAPPEGDGPHYIVANYELFQQGDSPEKVRALLDDDIDIDFIVIDEIHYTKQRSAENMSRRKEIVTALVVEAGNANNDLHILGMSATPVINNLQEGKSLLEMIDGLHHDELGTRASVDNAMKLHQALSRIGLRWLPDYDPEFHQEVVSIDCSDYLDELRAVPAGNPMQVEQILTKARLQTIRDNIQEKTFIYTHYIGGGNNNSLTDEDDDSNSDGETIARLLADGIKEDGWKVGFYTGDDKTGLDRFINGDLDVLIGTAAIGTGVDGLQHVCSRLIFNALPWTNAEFEQIKGRIYRQGQRKDKVELIIPATEAEVAGEEWSWCQARIERLRHKKTVADCAVDGVVPEEQLLSPQIVTRDLQRWLDRLDSDGANIIERPKLVVPLPEPEDAAGRKRIASYGDFSKMNKNWNGSNSDKTHQRLKDNLEEWQQYHTLYREARKDWTVVPYEEMIAWCLARKNLTIGDFGCGEALIAEALTPEGHTVYSFDHVACNETVIDCDIADGVPLEDGQLDVAIFSLALMGSNFTDYIREAHRCLSIDGRLHIIEATSRFKELDGFTDGLHRLGFDIIDRPEERSQFTFIQATKSERKPKDNVRLNF